ncbi:hypothetical protein [Pseudosporangium ferrugineum]|uniref:Uncharacterized protein n=1 Tax=Pseudosporangium ferrugineum TaxID=439699 RepID=A0A2T0SBV3_9ACTN|nr:hypothetical protein [Pseudosporangium ferrugineum]PRY30897.1 hypothetical protein CLV70_104450 [Pseudosporangium ferrugineum]
MTSLVPLQVGDVIQVEEPGCCYGVGSVTLRVTEVHGLVYLDDGPWVMVDGVPLWSNGFEGEVRYAQVRLEVIRHLPHWPSSRNAS